MIDPVAVAAAAALAVAAAGGAPDPIQEARAFRDRALTYERSALAPATGWRQARRWARRRAHLVPLPPGGNFNGIEWADATGPISLVDADQVLQFNAECQWLRARADGRSPLAGAVLAEIARWPAMSYRSPPDALAPVGSRREAQLRACERSHAEQVAYARRLGLEPSR